MRHIEIYGWITGLALFAASAHAEDNLNVQWTATLAVDAADGSTLVSGYAETQSPQCAPTRRAYLARRTAEGSEVWRTAIPPIGGLQELEIDAVLAAEVHAAAVDPATGEIFVTAEMLTAWQSAGCAAGVATAIGTSILRLDAQGTVLGDTYFGERPTGPAPATFSCEQRCAPHRLPQIIGRSVVVDEAGLVQIAGGRIDPAQRTAEDAFVTTLTSSLAPWSPRSGLTIFKSHGGGLTDLVCTIPSESYLVSISTLADTLIKGPQASLSSVDDCILEINYGGETPSDHYTYPSYGIEASFSLPPDSANLRLSIDMKVPSYYPDTAAVTFLVWDRQQRRFVEFEQIYPRFDKSIKAELNHGNPSLFLNAEGNLRMRVVFTYNATNPMYAESVDIDQLEIEPY
ncbi:MAG: hypothetical protein AAF560_08275 [Acidobacteriota bacterium]